MLTKRHSYSPFSTQKEPWFHALAQNKSSYSGRNFRLARERLADLLLRQGRAEEARIVLSAAPPGG